MFIFLVRLVLVIMWCVYLYEDEIILVNSIIVVNNLKYM